MKRVGGSLVAIVLSLSLASPSGAQTPPSPAPAQSASAAPASGTKTFSQQELDQLLAPIALYPDALLAQVLMASTYPLDVVAAERWVHGRAIGGFAVIGYPAKYGSSGIMTFLVNQDGKIYQKDLGPQTAARASTTRIYDPGEGWSAVTAR